MRGAAGHLAGERGPGAEARRQARVSPKEYAQRYLTQGCWRAFRWSHETPGRRRRPTSWDLTQQARPMSSGRRARRAEVQQVPRRPGEERVRQQALRRALQQVLEQAQAPLVTGPQARG